MLKRSICLAQGNRKLELNGGRDTCWGSTSDWRFTRTFYWVSIGPLHKAPEAVAIVWAARKIEVTELVFLLGECWLLTFTSGGGDDGARSKEATVTTRAKAFPSHVGSRMGLPDIGVSMKCRRPDALLSSRERCQCSSFWGWCQTCGTNALTLEDRLAGCYCHGKVEIDCAEVFHMSPSTCRAQ